MNTGTEIKHGRDQEATYQYGPFAFRENIYEDAIQRYMPKKTTEIKEQAVDIIIAAAKDIRTANEFQENV